MPARAAAARLSASKRVFVSQFCRERVFESGSRPLSVLWLSLSLSLEESVYDGESLLESLFHSRACVFPINQTGHGIYRRSASDAAARDAWTGDLVRRLDDQEDEASRAPGTDQTVWPALVLTCWSSTPASKDRFWEIRRSLCSKVTNTKRKGDDTSPPHFRLKERRVLSRIEKRSALVAVRASHLFASADAVHAAVFLKMERFFCKKMWESIPSRRVWEEDPQVGVWRLGKETLVGLSQTRYVFSKVKCRSSPRRTCIYSRSFALFVVVVVLFF